MKPPRFQRLIKRTSADPRNPEKPKQDEEQLLQRQVIFADVTIIAEMNLQIATANVLSRAFGDTVGDLVLSVNRQ